MRFGTILREALLLRCALAALSLFGFNSPQALAVCVDTPPFNDDWGWDEQRGASCRLSEQSSPTTESSDCIDTPPFTDDWGWNATLGESCRLSAAGSDATDDETSTDDSASDAACVDTPPFDDDWGWNETLRTSCRLGSTPVDSDTGTVATGSCVDTPPFDDDWGWNATLAESCRLSAADGADGEDDTAAPDTSGQCVDTPPFDDDWGWNQALGESCRLVADSGQPGSGYQPYPYSSQTGGPRVGFDWTPALASTWRGIKRRSVDNYAVPLVHRPRSEQPGDAVSEGVGYGMIVALFSNDQTYFNSIWDAGEQHLWNGEYYDWRAAEDGTTIGFGAATDAEQDIAMMLLLADELVDRGIWQGGHRSPQGATYAARAQDLLALIWDTMVDEGRYLRPGNFWGGKDLLNPGYFAPAWYRLYAQFDQEPSHDWMALLDQSYRTIAASPGYSRGLVPDWSNAFGGLLSDGPGYNAYDNGQSMYKDGIRTLWRIATDALWFNDSRAQNYLRNAMRFINDRAVQSGTTADANSPAHMANFFQMNGSEVPRTDIWTEFNGGNSQRSRNEHSHLTIAMWASAAIGAGDSQAAEAFSRELALFYEGGDFFGLSSDPSGNNEDIAHNELYFDQFLAWFGAAVLNGNFCNPLDCIR
jgi:hypothetical protein